MCVSVSDLQVPEYAREVFCTVFRNIGVLQLEKSAQTKPEVEEKASFFMALAHTLVQVRIFHFDAPIKTLGASSIDMGEVVTHLQLEKVLKVREHS